MFQFVSKYLQVPTICNVAALAAVWARQISGQLKVRSPQARTDQAVCCKSMAWHLAVRAG